jgi:hypothetical protein
MALGSTQPLVKMSTRDVPGGKGAQCVRLTTYHHIMPMSRNLGDLTHRDSSGPAWPVMGVLYLYLVYTVIREACSTHGISQQIWTGKLYRRMFWGMILKLISQKWRVVVSINFISLKIRSDDCCDNGNERLVMSTSLNFLIFSAAWK